MNHARYIARHLAKRLLPSVDSPRQLEAAENRLFTEIRAIAQKCATDGMSDGLACVAGELGYCEECGGSRQRTRMTSAYRGMEIVACADCAEEVVDA